jgi:hypothetical protein
MNAPYQDTNGTSDAVKDAFGTLNALKASFTALAMSRTRLSQHNKPKPAPARRPGAGRQPITVRLPAFPSTWRSPITPCQGALHQHPVAKVMAP